MSAIACLRQSKKYNFTSCDTFRMNEQDQVTLCREHGREFMPCPPDSKLGVAPQTLGQTPIHGLRHPPVGEANGWYLWAGEYSSDGDFFQPLHASHLIQRLPEVVRFLGLPPGSRFLLAGEYVDVWFDESLLKVSFVVGSRLRVYLAKGNCKMLMSPTVRSGALVMLIALLRFPITTVAVPPPSSVQVSAIGADAAAGKHLFERHCAVCHGIEGKGGRGPGLNRVQLAHAPDDTALKSVISDGISPDMPAGWFLTDEDVANLTAYVRSLSKVPSEPVPGDGVRGARVYAKGGCSNCHIIAGAGFGFGPELSNIGIRRSAPYIRNAIVKPGATMPEGFLLVEAITPAGDKIEGIRVNEDTFSIQIKDATGQFHSLRKQDLKDLQKLRGETPMPSYEGVLNTSELDDLVAYLASLRGKQ